MKFFTKKCGAFFLILLSFCLTAAGIFTHKRADLSIPGGSEPERIAFLEQNGWQICAESPEILEIRIPEIFDDVYKNYNKIQTSQGFDLEKYAGKTVKRYQYRVTNHPNYSGEVRANLLILDRKIIGGDICSLDLGGFMHEIRRKKD